MAVGLGLLIFQDLAIIIMVLLVPYSVVPVARNLVCLGSLKSIGIITIVLVFARRLMPRYLRSRSNCSGIVLARGNRHLFSHCLLTSLAGVSLSLRLSRRLLSARAALASMRLAKQCASDTVQRHFLCFGGNAAGSPLFGS